MELLNKSKLSTLIRINEFHEKFGIDATMIKFNISGKTVRNYISLYNMWKKSGENTPRPKILVFDIETSLLVGVTFGVWKTNITHEKILKQWNMISWAAKWLFEPEVFGDVQTSEEAFNGDDKRICQSLWEMIDEADIIIAHNGDKFDIKKMNTRFLVNGLTPPSPYRSIDTLKAVKQMFGFSHNRLQAINDILGIDVKTEHSGIDMWIQVLKGDEEALNEMFDYNKNDVVILEELYLAIRAWIPNHPNVAVFYDSDVNVCHKCGSPFLIEKEGNFHQTQIGLYKTYQCGECGAYSKGRERVGSTTKLTNVPRF